MIVVDASVMVELLTNGLLAASIRRALSIRSDLLIAPCLLDIEVLSALRGLAAGRHIDAHRAEQMIATLADVPLERYDHTPLLPRIWELRHNFTCYDAAYIALAEATESIFYTADAKLKKGHRADVLVFAE